MRPFIGSALVLLILGAPAWALYRIIRGVEGWFSYNPGAGNTIGWTLTACVVLLLLGLTAVILAGASGLAARAWVVRLEEGQRLESTAHTLTAPRGRPQLGAYVDAEALAVPRAE